MRGYKMEDKDLEVFHSALHTLLTLEIKDSTCDLVSCFEENIHGALKILNCGTVHDLPLLEKAGIFVSSESSVRWRFTCVILHIILSVKDYLSAVCEQTRSESMPEQAAACKTLLSIKQRKQMQKGLQFVVRFGLLPNLLPGVGIPLEIRSRTVEDVEAHLKEEIPVMEGYRRLVAVTQALVEMSKEPELRSLVMADHFGDLIAALLQLTSAPLKKPASSSKSSSVQGEAGVSDFVMTYAMWEELQRERKHFCCLFQSLIETSHQPMVIRELLLLQGASHQSQAKKKYLSPPMWIKRACSQHLTTCVLKPGGLNSLVRAVCDLSADTGSDWSKQDVLARLITAICEALPEKASENICPQVIDLLCLEDDPHNLQYIEVARMCMKTMSEKNPTIFEENLLKSLTYPLVKCTSTVSNETGRVLVSEKEMEFCIKCLHRSFVPKSDLTAVSVKWLLPVSGVLYKLYTRAHNSVSYLKSNIQELLVKVLRECNSDFRENAFCVFIYCEKSSTILDVNSEVEFEFGSSGGIQVVRMEGNDGEDMFSSNVDDNTDCLLDLLECNESGQLLYHLFVFLLKNLSEKLCGGDELPSLSNNTLMDIEDHVEIILGHSKKHLLTLNLLSSLIENASVKKSIEENPSVVIDFLEVLLTKIASSLADGTADAEDEHSEGLFVSLMVLSVLVVDRKLKPNEWETLQGTVKPLKVIMDKVSNTELQFLAEELYEMILTRGVHSTKKFEKTRSACGSSASPTQNKENKKSPPSHKTKRSPMPDPQKDKESDAKSKTKLFNTNAESGQSSRFQKALFDLFDPMIPVRGHALLELSKLVKERDAETVKEKSTVLHIFQENLDHGDSYIYLMSVKGLATMAYVFPDNVIKTLCDEYMEIRTKPNKEPEDVADLRIKIGEVLLQVTKSLGEMAPKYKTPLLNAFLVGTRDPDHLVRASSLSNLGEICRVLRFQIGPIIQEILLCVRSIVRTDPAVEVRRAAVMVITLLLNGLGVDAIKVLQDVLLELYRTLKLVHQQESDDVVKLHVELALDELNKATVDFMFPKLGLKKTINVLFPPDSL